MLLKYVPFLELKTGKVSSLDFSRCGKMLAVANVAGEISLWDTQTGNRYNPVLHLDSVGNTATLWVDDVVFICGLSNGSLVTCKLVKGSAATPNEFVRDLEPDLG
jgi:WD40 repeat protein